MTPADLSRTVVRAVRCAVEDGELPAGATVPERVVVERTRPGGAGEYATPVAFQIAKSAGNRAPLEVARVLARRLAGLPGIERVEITGAGFVNFALPPLSAAELVREVREVEARRPTVDAGVPADLPLGLRERAVCEAVVRIRRSQGLDATVPARVAPVAKRDGDVVARYGADAARWAMLTVPARETPGFCDRLLVQGEDSEFFRVRYARARSRALTANAAQLGFTSLPGDLGLTSLPGDVEAAPALLRAVADHPLALEAAAHHRAPERLARHLVELADALLDFQHRVLPQGDEKPSAAHRARLALAEAAGTVLAGGLSLLGIDAPTRL
ncbi:ArgS-related anticodon-binding protein NrtL [Streptomyces sp. NPDC003038]|uniref:ArgS-related anticodon-binding protein NrtL n=1 Tax=unclassified Streptomyces TaxID=2593676 RepID=UPI0033B63255